MNSILLSEILCSSVLLKVFTVVEEPVYGFEAFLPFIIFIAVLLFIIFLGLLPSIIRNILERNGHKNKK